MSKRMSWATIEKTYPNMWAFMTNVRREHGIIIDCEFICAVPFADMASTMHRLKEEGVDFERERTTENMPTTGVVM